MRLVGRLSARPAAACAARAVTSCGPFGCRGAARAGRRSRSSGSTPSSAPCGAGARGASVATWAADDVVEVRGALRRRFFPSGGGAGVSRGGGADVRRPAHSSCRERMSTPTLGFGWNDVAFSGSSRPPAATGGQVEVRGRHQHGDALCRAEPVEGRLDRVVVLDPAGRRGSAGTRSSWRARRRPGPRAACSLRVAQRRPSVSDERGRRQARRPRRGGRPASSWHRRPRRRRRGRRGVTPVRIRWIGAEEERGVVLVDEHREAAVVGPPGCAAAASAGRPRSGGVRRRSGPGVRPAPRRARRASLGSRIAQTRCRCSARSTKSSTGGSASTWCTISRTPAGAAVHEQDRRRVELPARSSGRRARRPAPGGCPRAGGRRGPRRGWPGARCRARRRGRAR